MNNAFKLSVHNSKMLDDVSALSLLYYTPLLKCKLWRVRSTYLQKISDEKLTHTDYKKYITFIEHFIKNKQLRYGDLIMHHSSWLYFSSRLCMLYYDGMIKQINSTLYWVWKKHKSTGVVIPLNYWYPWVKQVKFDVVQYKNELIKNYKNGISWFMIDKIKCMIIMSAFNASDTYKHVMFTQLIGGKFINYDVKPYEQYIMTFYC